MNSRALSACVLTTIILLSGCYDDRIAKLEKQNQELLAEVKKDHAATDYDMQVKCANQSKTWFKENWIGPDKNQVFLDYTDHYDKKLNQCFILVEYHYTFAPPPSWVNMQVLYDVNENNKYGEMSVTHTIFLKSENRTDDRVGPCKVAGKGCRTEAEFGNLISPFMTD